MRHCKTGPFALSKQEHLLAVHFIRNYTDTKYKYFDILHASSSSSFDGTYCKTSIPGDPVGDTVAALEPYGKKITLIEDAAKWADKENWRYLIKSVEQDETREALIRQGLTLSKDKFYRARQAFIWRVYTELSDLLNNYTPQQPQQ